MSSLLPKLILAISASVYAFFWIWSIVHAASTPKTPAPQRAFWAMALALNPVSGAWYWYVWKKWAFWILITPLFAAFLSFPFVIKSTLAQADKNLISRVLSELGTTRLLTIVATLMVFPFLMRLAALLHIGTNSELDAKDRNNWVIPIAVPIFGFGSAVAYCAKYRHAWAMAALIWSAALFGFSRPLFGNLIQILVDQTKR